MLLGFACLAISLLYFNSMDLKLYADDFLTWNKAHSARNFSELVSTTFNPEFYRPLELSLVRFNLAVSGFNSAPYHLITLIGHLLTALVLYTLARRAQFPFATALVAMLIFGISNVNAMAILGNDTAGQVFGSLFGLLAISQIIGKNDIDWKSLALSSIFLFISLLWKDSSISFVAAALLIILWKWIPQKRYSDLLRNIAPILAVLTLYLILRHNAGAISPGMGHDGRYQIWFGLNIPKNIILIFGAMLTPLGTTVLLAHRSDSSLIAASIIIVIMVMASILYGTYISWKKTRAPLFHLGLWFVLLFIMIFPDCLINHISELYAYKPNALFSLLLASSFIAIYTEVLDRGRLWRFLLMGSAICFLVCNVLSIKHKEQLMRINGIKATQMLREIKTQVPEVPQGTTVLVSNLDREPDLIYSVFFMHGVAVLGAGSFFEVLYGNKLAGYQNIPAKQLPKHLAELKKPTMLITYDMGRINAEFIEPGPI